MMHRILTALLVSSAPLAATLLETTVTADTYLRGDTATTTPQNDDADNEILIGSNGALDNFHPLLRFDVSSIVDDVNSIGGGNFANLTINFASLQVFERRGRAQTVNFIVNDYGFAFDPTVSTWVDPAAGDTTAGGTIGTALGSQSVTWDASPDGEDATINLSGSLLATSISNHLSNSIHLILNTDTPATNWFSLSSDRAVDTTRDAKLVVDYTVTPAGGPVLTIDPSSPDTNYAFPSSSTAASPLTRTIRYENSGASGPITVNAITVTNTSGAAFSLGAVSPSVPATLSPGDSIDIPVLAIGAETASFTGSIFIDTDLDTQDKTLPLTASFHVPGTQYAANSSMSTSLASWGGASTFVTPGFITAGDGMARVRGVGDPAQAGVSALSQASSIPNELADWELDFRFSPVASAAFDSYAGQGIDGAFADRSFQLVVQSTDSVPAPGFTDGLADNTLINLAYLPDGTTSGGIAGFYLFNGATDTWQLVDFNGDGSALVLAGSVDVDTDGDSQNGVGDGVLNTSDGDTVNAYRLSIRGQGFGNGGASYSITLDGTGPGFPKTVSGLTIAHNQAIDAARPAGFAFITSDQSSESNGNNGFCPPFWVDEVGFFSTQRSAQRLLVFNTPSLIRSLNGAEATHMLTVFNDGASASVELSASLNGTSAVSLQSPPSFPTELAPGAQLDLTLGFDPLQLTAPDTAATGSLTLTSNDPNLASATYPYLATKVSDANLLANGDFESATGTGVFPVAWTGTGGPSPVASFLASGGGASAVTLTPSQGVLQDIAPTSADSLSDFQADFAFRFGNEAQAHRIRLEGDNGADLVTLRIIANTASTDSIDAFNAGTWVSALSDLSLAPDTTYYLRVIGRDFGLAGRRFTIGLSTDGTTFTDSASLAAFHASPNVSFETITFECGATAGSSLSVDNAIITVPPPADDFSSWMSGFTFTPGADLTPEGDADGDGIANVLENVFGTAPNAPTEGLSQLSGGAGALAFSHRLNASLASDVSYTYEWSTDLVEWQGSTEANSAGTVVEITAESSVADEVTVTATVTTGSVTKLFTRISAQQNP